MLWLNVVALKRAARRVDVNSITLCVMRLWGYKVIRLASMAALRSHSFGLYCYG